MNMRPVLAVLRVPPVKATAVSTAGSAWTMLMKRRELLLERLERDVLVGPNGRP